MSELAKGISRQSLGSVTWYIIHVATSREPKFEQALSQTLLKHVEKYEKLKNGDLAAASRHPRTPLSNN